MFGVDVREVQEVLVGQTATPVPLAPAHVAGLANLRGQIMPMFCLRRRLGMASRDAALPGANIVVRTAEGPVSLVVDDIGDVVEVDAGRWRDAPETVASKHRHFVKRICPIDGRLILELQVARVTDDDTTDASKVERAG
jgi:purine-binding chemotaxis protein CheW